MQTDGTPDIADFCMAADYDEVCCYPDCNCEDLYYEEMPLELPELMEAGDDDDDFFVDDDE